MKKLLGKLSASKARTDQLQICHFQAGLYYTYSGLFVVSVFCCYFLYRYSIFSNRSLVSCSVNKHFILVKCPFLNREAASVSVFFVSLSLSKTCSQYVHRKREAKLTQVAFMTIFLHPDAGKTAIRSPDPHLHLASTASLSHIIAVKDAL